jgi:hypothetical protein
VKRRIAAVLTTAALLVAGSSLPAEAAAWRVSFSSMSVPPARVRITLSPVRIYLSVHLQVPAHVAAVRSVRETLTAPGGARIGTDLWLSTGSRTRGTWHGQVVLAPEARGGKWRVDIAATSSRRQTATRSTSFTVRKSAIAPLTVRPAPVVVSWRGTAVTVKTFFAHRVDGAYATLTDPAGHASVVQLQRIAGDPYYGLWLGATRLPGSARPGTWKIATSTATSGVWSVGPAGRFTVHQTTMASLHASSRKVRAGQTVTLTGHVSAWSTNGKNVGLANRRLTFSYLMKAAGARWVRLGSVLTDRSGNYRFHFVIVRSGSVRASVAGGGLFVGVTTSTVSIAVH